MEVKELYDLFDEKYESEVKPYIERNVPRNELTAPVYHILDNFRLRRFRAAFPLLFAGGYRKSKDLVLPVGAASELVFTVALVQDDIIDGDNKRGEIDTSHKIFGVEKCIASCDFVHAYVARMLFELADQNVKPEILKRVFQNFIDAHRRLYKSFLIERLEAGNLNFSREKILGVYKDKTIQGTNALTCSALLCSEDSNLVERVRSYSYNLGIAGQIKNDIYDITRYIQSRGYSDLENRYVTYIIRKLIDSTKRSERKRVLQMIKEKDDESLIKILIEKGITQSCIRDCSFFVDSAISRIRGKFPQRLEEILIVWAEGNRKFSKNI